MLLARYADLSPWKGGGFGMFASIDGTPYRSVRLFVQAEERDEELAVPPSLEDLATRVATFPHRRAVERLAARAIDREIRRGRPVDRMRVEVWRADFSPTLDATHTRVRALTVSRRDGTVDWSR